MLNKIKRIGKEIGLEKIQIKRYISKNSSLSYMVGSIDSSKTKETTSMIIEVIHDGKKGGTIINNMDDSTIRRALKNLKEVVENKTFEKEQKFIKKNEYNYQEISIPKSDIDTITSEEMVNKIEEFKKIMASKEKRIDLNNGTISFSISFSEEKMSNTLDLDLKNSSVFGYIYAGLIGENEMGEKIDAGGYIGGINKSDIDVEKLAEIISLKFKRKSAKSVLKNGEYNVVYGNDVVSSLFGPILGHVFGRSVIDGRSIFKDKLQKQIFDKKLTVIDEGINEDAFVYNVYDSEGMPTKRKEFIKNGVLTTFLTDSLSAKILDQKKSTGNAGGFGVVSIEKGKKTLEKIFEEMGEGVYLTAVKGVHSGFNSTNGDFSLESNGYIIENGKIKHSFNTCIATGNIIDALNSINEIGNDVDRKIGKSFPSIWSSKKINLST